MEGIPLHCIHFLYPLANQS